MPATGDDRYVDDHEGQEQAWVPPRGKVEIDAWASAVVATAMKILWALPTDATTNEVRRRVARAEAIRIGRKQQRTTRRAPESERAAPRTGAPQPSAPPRNL